MLTAANIQKLRQKHRNSPKKLLYFYRKTSLMHKNTREMFYPPMADAHSASPNKTFYKEHRLPHNEKEHPSHG